MPSSLLGAADWDHNAPVTLRTSHLQNELYAKQVDAYTKSPLSIMFTTTHGYHVLYMGFAKLPPLTQPPCGTSTSNTYKTC
jgi:hypothetical protein